MWNCGGFGHFTYSSWSIVVVLMSICIGSSLSAGIRTNSAASLESTCGQPADQHVKSEGERLVGGRESLPHAWPWTVQILRSGFHICGGALISRNYVLTAAHCVAGRVDVNRYSVVVGSHWIYSGRTHPVLNITRHPSYDRPVRAFDFAILRITPIGDTEPNAGIVCLPSGPIEDGKNCVVTGWGRLWENGPGAGKLRQIKVPIVSNGVCNNMLHYRGLIHPSMMCAGYEWGTIDSCQGDSGGPLMCKQGDDRYYLHGLVSWGNGCARARFPGVYSRISSAILWINSQMREV